MSKKYFFEDEEGYIWSCTWRQILKDAREYEEDSGETVDDPFEFLMDNFDECKILFNLESSPNFPLGPQYRGAIFTGVEDDTD